MDADAIARVPLFLLVFIVSGSIHEFAHAWTAWKLGDDTAEREGRLTLNPMVHVDPMGLMMLGISSMMGFGFGWMRPVPVNPYALAKPRRDMMLIAAAGPISNMLQALLLIVVVNLANINLMADTGAALFFWIAITLNVVLAAFNLVPFKPLDGYSVMLGLLPADASYKYENWASKWGPLLLIIFLLSGGISYLIGPLYMAIARVADFLTGSG